MPLLGCNIAGGYLSFLNTTPPLKLQPSEGARVAMGAMLQFWERFVPEEGWIRTNVLEAGVFTPPLSLSDTLTEGYLPQF